MAGIWARFRSEARWRWRGWLALAVLVGVGGGAVLGIVAGARRTDSAYERFVAESSPADYLVASGYFAVGRPIDPRDGRASAGCAGQHGGELSACAGAHEFGA